MSLFCNKVYFFINPWNSFVVEKILLLAEFTENFETLPSNVALFLAHCFCEVVALLQDMKSEVSIRTRYCMQTAKLKAVKVGTSLQLTPLVHSPTRKLGSYSPLHHYPDTVSCVTNHTYFYRARVVVFHRTNIL